MPSIVDLPPELLDEIWSYLDWDRSVYLTPSYEARESVFNISLTCNHLRKSILPTLFRHVALALRWDEDEFLVPSLIQISRHRSDLAKHINCIHIKAEHSWGTTVADKRKALPEDIADGSRLHKTLKVAGSWECHEDLRSKHRNSVGEALSIFHAESISTPTPRSRPSSSQQNPPLSAQPDTAEKNEGNDTPSAFHLRASPQAFWLVAACFPPAVKEIVFDGSEFPTKGPRMMRLAFGILFVALEVFKNRIERVTMLAQSCGVSHAIDEMSFHYAQDRQQGLARLHKIKSLTFAASTSSANFPLSSTTATLQSQGCFYWHQTSHTVTNLDLRNLQVDPSAAAFIASSDRRLLTFLRGFPNLRSLSMFNVALCPFPRVLRRNNNWSEVEWLNFLISFRNEKALVTIRLDNIASDFEQKGRLPASGVKWLLEEAVPVGAVIDQERANRLAEDFASFLFLWRMEDSAPGQNAAADSSREHLVDVAMRNRAIRFR